MFKIVVVIHKNVFIKNLTSGVEYYFAGKSNISSVPLEVTRVISATSNVKKDLKKNG